MVVAIVSCCRLFVCTSAVHAVDLMGMEIGGRMIIGMMGVMMGIPISNAGYVRGIGRIFLLVAGTVCSHNKFSSYAYPSVIFVTASNCYLLALFDMSTVSAYASKAAK